MHREYYGALGINYLGKLYICCYHYGNNMAYIVGRKRKGKSGTLTYYYLVEGYREGGKVKQRVLEYLGTTPFQTMFELEPGTSVKVAEVLSNMERPGEEIGKELEALGISVPPGKIKEVKLVFKPPLGKVSVYIA